MVIEKQSNNCVNHNKNKNRKIEIKNLIIPPGFYYINTMNKNFKKWKKKISKNGNVGKLTIKPFMWLFICWSIKILRNLFLFNYLALVHHVEKTTIRQNLIFVYTNSPVNFHKHITIHTSGNIHHQQTRPSVLIIAISNLSLKFIKFPTNIISLSLRYIFFS